MTGANGTRSPLIEARGVTKSFGQTQALRGASVAVAAGEILAVMGPSGSACWSTSWRCGWARPRVNSR